jgi:hypothetical protein
MYPKTSTRFDMALRGILWVVICIFTGVALADVALAAGRKRKMPVADSTYSVVPPKPPGGCAASDARMTITAINNTTYQAFRMNSSVLCGGGVDANSQCPYFTDWTLWYLWFGVWLPVWSDTEQYFDTCGQRDARSFDVQTGPGTYNIQIKMYSGTFPNDVKALLGTTGGTFSF